MGAASVPIRIALRLGSEEDKAKHRRRIAGPLWDTYTSSMPQANAADAHGSVQDGGSGDDELPDEQEYTRVMRKLLTIRHPRLKRTAKSKFKLIGIVAKKRVGAVWGSTKWSREELAKKVSATARTITAVTLLSRPNPNRHPNHTMIVRSMRDIDCTIN